MNNIYLHIDEYQVYTTDLNGRVKYTIEIHSYASIRNEIYFVTKIKNNRQQLWTTTDCFMRIPKDFNFIPHINFIIQHFSCNSIEQDIIKTTFPIYITKYLDKDNFKKRIICMRGV